MPDPLPEAIRDQEALRPSGNSSVCDGLPIPESSAAVGDTRMAPGSLSKAADSTPSIPAAPPTAGAIPPASPASGTASASPTSPAASLPLRTDTMVCKTLSLALQQHATTCKTLSLALQQHATTCKQLQELQRQAAQRAAATAATFPQVAISVQQPHGLPSLPSLPHAPAAQRQAHAAAQLLAASSQQAEHPPSSQPCSSGASSSTYGSGDRQAAVHSDPVLAAAEASDALRQQAKQLVELQTENIRLKQVGG
jgi:hypothetical protein